MTITADAMHITPFMLNNFAEPPAPNLGQHVLYDWNDVRVNVTVEAGGIPRRITLQSDPQGDTIFLPFLQDQITSVRLPAPAPAGVTRFLTANMSGCKIFIDQLAGSNDLIVYHANSGSNSPPQNTSATRPTVEMPAATAELDRLHQVAQTHWTGAPHGLVVARTTSLGKPRYNMGAAAAIQRKVGQRRTQVEFTGGTLVAGFPVGAGWEFYFQTWGGIDYNRPGLSWRRTFLREDAHHGAFEDLHVLECARFY